MRLAEMTKEVSNQLSEVSERYQVPQRLRRASDAACEAAYTASDAARRSARQAYRVALDHPRASAAAGVILAAAVVGGLLWYIFGNEDKTQRNKTRPRVRARTERRKQGRSAKASASA
jgi:hypothetical protein